MKQLIITFFALAFSLTLLAQNGTAFGIRGGNTFGNQKWNGSERDFLPAYHVAAFIESYSDSVSFSFFGDIGYHVKGSAIRFRDRFVNDPSAPNGQRFIEGGRIRQPFQNISLILGVKNRHALSETIKGYYMFGGRVDYTIKYDIVYLIPENFVRPFNYGLSLGGGIEFSFKNFPAALFLELSFHPDISKQILFENLPYATIYGEPVTASQKVVNFPFEISVGYKFIRKVEWVEFDEDEY